MVSWVAPQDLTNVTHFRIYADGNADANLAREVSVGQTEEALSASDAWVSSYNLPGGSESIRVRAAAATPDPNAVSDPSEGIIAYYA